MSAKITTQEFETMISELISGNGKRPEMLCHLAERTLKSSVRSWCHGKLSVAKGHEEDILQEIAAKLISETVDGFLLKEDANSSSVTGPERFRKWMFTVAGHVAVDYVKHNFKPIVDIGYELLENQ